MIVIHKTDSLLTVHGHAADQTTPRCDESMQACASVTALVQTMLYGIQDICCEYPQHTLDKGDFSMSLEHLTERAQLLVDAFCLGCRYLSTAYPRYISFSE